MTKKFDEAFDVMVVGYGFAGAVAAIEAAKDGACVLILEKTADPGEISVCTQARPVQDAGQRIIDVHGAPIPRLFAAGEMGSCFGHLYLAGGNIAECFFSGWTAGRNAAKLDPC